MGKPVVQWQVISTKPDEHSAFYAKLFDWTVQSDNPLGYRMIDTGSERGIPGGFWPAPPGVPPFAQLIVEVDDLEDAIARANTMGGTVLIPPQNLPGGEAMAVLRDPMGMSFAIFRPVVK